MVHRIISSVLIVLSLSVSGQRNFLFNQHYGQDGGPGVMAPGTKMISITNITQTTATFNGQLIYHGSHPTTARGFSYNTVDDDMAWQWERVTVAGTTLGNYSYNISGLTPNTTYYVRTFGTNETGTQWNEAMSFTTAESIGAPVVILDSVLLVSDYYYTGGLFDYPVLSLSTHGRVTNTGGELIESGILIGETPSPNINDVDVWKRTSGANLILNDYFHVSPSVSYCNSDLYIRAYAINSAGVSYSNEIVKFISSHVFPYYCNSTVVENIFGQRLSTWNASLEYVKSMVDSIRVWESNGINFIDYCRGVNIEKLEVDKPVFSYDYPCESLYSDVYEYSIIRLGNWSSPVKIIKERSYGIIDEVHTY